MKSIAPAEHLKDIYWVGHFLFFIIMCMSGIITHPERVDLEALYYHSFLWVLGFCFFIVIDRIFINAIEEKLNQSDKTSYQFLYTISLTSFSIILNLVAVDKISPWAYVIPVALISLAGGVNQGIFSSLFLGTTIIIPDGTITFQNGPVIMCLLLLAWLVGQISEINFRQALQIENEKRFLAELVETFTGGIVISNDAAEVILCNREIEKILNITRENIIGKGESLLWVNSSVPYHNWKPNFINMELNIGPRHYLVNRFCISGQVPSNKHYVTVINDITELHAQRARMQSLSTLSAVGELAAGAAHEIKNPLTTIRGFLQILNEKWPNQKFSGLCALSLEELDRINQIVNSMLQLAKPEKDELLSLNLNNIVYETWDLYSSSPVRKGINVISQLDENLPNIIGSRKQMKQVLLNLFQNAEKACAGGDTITVKTYMDAGWACLEVADTGHGISPENIEKLFHPFFTTDPSGTGIGLAICNRIISDHNGRILVKSEPGVGTSFIVCFKPDEE